jgi:hypothetical protein
VTKPAKTKAKKKAAPKKKRMRFKKRAPRNWAKLNEDWLRSSLTFTAFCRLRKLPYTTAQQYLTSPTEKSKLLRRSAKLAEGFRDKILQDTAKEQAKDYVTALRLATAATKEVLLSSADAFVTMPRVMDTKDAGRLTLAAGEMLVKHAAELQGIPKEDEIDGWPLSKGFSPFSYQRDFIHDTPETIRLEEGKDVFIFAFIGGVGSGKTYCGAQKAGQLAFLNRGHMGMILAPTYKMLEDATKPAFFKALSQKGLSYRYRKSENSIILFGDTKILFRSMDIPEHLAGPDLAWAWPDEGLQMSNREAFDIVNARIRGDEKPCKAMIFTGTPDGLNWGYEILVQEAERNKVRLYRARTQDNPVLGDYYERLKASYDPKYAKQQLEAVFLNVFAGQAYESFDPKESVFEPEAFEMKDNLPIDLCCDFNVAPMCWNVAQDIRQNSDVWTYVFDEIHLDTANTQTTIDEFLDRYGERGRIVRVYGDATGRSRATSASRSDYEIIERALKRAKMFPEINIGKSNPRQADSVASLNARLLNALGQRRFYISSVCKNTLTDFERTGWIPGTRQLDKGDKERTHHTDALRYKTAYDWPIYAMEVRTHRAGN